jgi:hypothetical protein
MKEFYTGISADKAPSALLPVFSGATLSGKLCMSWEGSKGELFDNDIEALRLLSGLVGRRRFAVAHNGNLICKSSEPTLSNPRRKDSEGFLTTFEVRLSRVLRAGPTEVKI